MPERTCNTCGCWKPCREWNDKRYGECRGHCPSLCFEAERSSCGYWPETREDDWCGDHTGLRSFDLPGPNRGA